jgi:hypothetical protein
MKRYAFLFLAILLASCGNTANQFMAADNSLHSAGLKGKVKTITTSHYNHYHAGSGGAQKTLIRETVDSYNENGYITESRTTIMANRGHTQNEVSRHVYKYDNRFNLTEHIVYDNEGKITQNTTTQFNDKNKPANSKTTVLFSEINSVMRMEYLYDSAGNNIEIKMSSEDSNAFTGVIYLKNNEKAQCIERISMAQKGNMESRQTSGYDSSGRVTEKCDFDDHGNLAMRSSMKYDKNGLLLECSTSSFDGSIIDKQSNKYDDFDSKGNWLQLTSVNGNGLNSTTERKIKYYW